MTSTSWQVIDGAAGIAAGCLAVLLIAVIRHAGSWLARRAVVTWQAPGNRNPANRGPDNGITAGSRLDGSNRPEDYSEAADRAA